MLPEELRVLLSYVSQDMRAKYSFGYRGEPTSSVWTLLITDGNVQAVSQISTDLLRNLTEDGASLIIGQWVRSIEHQRRNHRLHHIKSLEFEPIMEV